MKPELIVKQGKDIFGKRFVLQIIRINSNNHTFSHLLNTDSCRFEFVQNHGSPFDRMIGTCKITGCKKCNYKRYDIVIYPDKVNHFTHVNTLEIVGFLKGAWVEPAERLEDHFIDWFEKDYNKILIKNL